MKTLTIVRLVVMVLSWIGGALIIAKLVNAAAVNFRTSGAATVRSVCRANLVLVCLVTLFVIFGYCTPRRTPLPQNDTNYKIRIQMETTCAAVVLASWLSGAVGLFFRKPLAWHGSILGAGVMAALTAGAFLITTWELIFPPPGVELPVNNHLGFYLFAGSIMLVFVCFPMAASWWLLSSLIRMRREFFIEPPVDSTPSAIG